MKKFYFLLLLYLFNTAVNGQQINQAVIASAGSIDKAAGISLEWTLGEPMVESLHTNDKLITQGFHQPLLLVKKFYLAKQTGLSGYKVSIAPNPVQAYLRVAYEIPPAKEITLTLSDFTGRSFSVQQAEQEKGFLSFDMSRLIAGAYLLHVNTKEGKLIQSFKIIKGQ